MDNAPYRSLWWTWVGLIQSPTCIAETTSFLRGQWASVKIILIYKSPPNIQNQLQVSLSRHIADPGGGCLGQGSSLSQVQNNVFFSILFNWLFHSHPPQYPALTSGFEQALCSLLIWGFLKVLAAIMALPQSREVTIIQYLNNILKAYSRAQNLESLVSLWRSSLALAES